MDTLTITEEFSDALELLHGGKKVFLTGKAGTGKSTLIRLFLEQTKRKTITVAPTGIAALNVGGYTIHRLLSLPHGVNEEYVKKGHYYPRRFGGAIRKLDTLIVDEASMVRADLFDAMVVALERFGPNPDEPFGGVQLVLVGDLYQLPPVIVEEEHSFIAQTYGTPFFFSAHSYNSDDFPTKELTQVFRQSGDNKLIRLLNDVREGTLLEEARAELNCHTDPDFEPELDQFWVTLATTNRIVKSRNNRMLQQLTLSPQLFSATLTGDLDGFELPTDRVLQLAPGAQVMLLNNDSANRWVNGSIGRVERIAGTRKDPIVSVLLRNGKLVEVRRHVWEVTRPYVEQGALQHQIVGTFDQLPMKLAWAVTIHKSQGQTLDRVIVDLTGGTFANGQLYVALSRCTTLEGLVLKRDVLPRDLKTDMRVRRFLTSKLSSKVAVGEVYISVLFVGNEGDRYRPRPIEIAVATSDGDQATTVVNPTSDLFNAETDYGITTRDVALAPVLHEAWAALSPLLEGRIPVGVNIDETLGLIDFELKRGGMVARLPTAVELPVDLLNVRERHALFAPTAQQRVHAVRDAAARLGKEKLFLAQGTPFEPASGVGYLQDRVSGFVGNPSPIVFTVGGSVGVDPAASLGVLLGGAWRRIVDCDQSVVDRLRAAEKHYGVEILPEDYVLEDPPEVKDILVPGARICFTGTVVSPKYGYFEREEMEYIAIGRGLNVSKNVTKTRTDALVVAQRGSQSRKAKDAARWGKPVLCAEDFLDWAQP